MKFSLIVGTLNRADTIRYCIKSLLEQTYPDYEIIVVDQSNDRKTSEIIKEINDDRIIYKHVDFKGLSKARNEGLRYACGEYFCLIDDDAYYNKDFLQTAYNYIVSRNDESTILSGYIHDTNQGAAFASYKEEYNEKILNIQSVIHSCPSAGLAIPRSVISLCGDFDEKLGVGSEFGAGEETDLLLRAISKGFKVIYISKMILKHPFPEKGEDAISEEGHAKKMASYYRGIGALYKKQLIYERNVRVAIPFLRLCIKFVIKYIMFFRFDRKRTKMEISGLAQGLRLYRA